MSCELSTPLSKPFVLRVFLSCEAFVLRGTTVLPTLTGSSQSLGFDILLQDLWYFFMVSHPSNPNYTVDTQAMKTRSIYSRPLNRIEVASWTLNQIIDQSRPVLGTLAASPSPAFLVGFMLCHPWKSFIWCGGSPIQLLTRP